MKKYLHDRIQQNKLECKDGELGLNGDPNERMLNRLLTHEKILGMIDELKSQGYDLKMKSNGFMVVTNKNYDASFRDSKLVHKIINKLKLIK